MTQEKPILKRKRKLPRASKGQMQKIGATDKEIVAQVKKIEWGACQMTGQQEGEDAERKKPQRRCSSVVRCV